MYIYKRTCPLVLSHILSLFHAFPLGFSLSIAFSSSLSVFQPLIHALILTVSVLFSPIFHLLIITMIINLSNDLNAM